MQDVSFPARPSSTDDNDTGRRAIFEVGGATEMLGSYLNANKAEMGLDGSGPNGAKFEFIVSSRRPDQVMVVCSAEVTAPEFKRAIASISRWGHLIKGETLGQYAIDRDTRIKDSMANPSEVKAYDGS